MENLITSKTVEFRKDLRTAFYGFLSNGVSVDAALQTTKGTAKLTYKGSDEAFETQFELAFKDVKQVREWKKQVRETIKLEQIANLKNRIANQLEIIKNGDIDCIDEIMNENTFAVYHKKTGLRCTYEKTKVESNELPCMKFKDVNGAKRISYIHCFEKFFELKAV